jgi:DNA-binding CsgD family transcriptional regulator
VSERNLYSLTPRERQIYEALLQGATTRQVADAHGLGRQTVKNYVTVIYEKLGITNRMQLLQMAALPRAGAPVSAGGEAGN